jgi:hypothetical protein
VDDANFVSCRIRQTTLLLVPATQIHVTPLPSRQLRETPGLAANNRDAALQPRRALFVAALSMFVGAASSIVHLVKSAECWLSLLMSLDEDNPLAVQKHVDMIWTR